MGELGGLGHSQWFGKRILAPQEESQSHTEREGFPAPSSYREQGSQHTGRSRGPCDVLGTGETADPRVLEGPKVEPRPSQKMLPHPLQLQAPSPHDVVSLVAVLPLKGPHTPWKRPWMQTLPTLSPSGSHHPGLVSISPPLPSLCRHSLCVDSGLLLPL